MERKIKMIWDFRGPECTHFAKHHAVHLEQFAKKEAIAHFGASFETVNEMHAFAYLIIGEKDKLIVRDALKPQRANWA